MSLYNYFQAAEAGVTQRNNVQLPHKEALGVSSTEYENIVHVLENVPVRRTRSTYKEEEKNRIARYANMFTVAQAVYHFKSEFPNIKESTIRPWLKKYRENLREKTPTHAIVLSKKRGRPLYLSNELDSKLQQFLKNLRKAGGGVNIHVVKGVLMGLIKSDLRAYGSLVDFQVTEGWLKSLYKRMNFTRRTVTTSRPIITRSICEEIRTMFLHKILSACIEHDIPYELKKSKNVKS